MALSLVNSKSKKGQLIAIVGAKGGIGKTTFAVNFALAMALDSKQDIAVIDADKESLSDVHLMVGSKKIPAYGDSIINGKVRGEKNLQSHFTKVKLAQNQSSLYLLQLLENLNGLHLVDEEKVSLSIRAIKKSFPYTIVDCGSQITPSTMSIIDEATLVIIVTNPEILVLNKTKELVQDLQSQSVPHQAVKIVVNRAIKGNPYNESFIKQTLGREVICTLSEDSFVVPSSLAKGVPFVVSNSQSILTKTLYSLSRKLVDKRLLEKLSQWMELQNHKGKVASQKIKSQSGEEDPRSVFKRTIQVQLVEKLDLKKEQLDRNLSVTQKLNLRKKAGAVVAEILSKEEHPWTGRGEIRKLSKEILDEALALGPLEDLLADPLVTEIMVNRCDQIYIERDGKNILSPVHFSSNERLLAVIERIVNPLGRRIDEKTPYVDARLPDGSRVHAIIPPLALDGPMVTIRKFPNKRLGPEDLIKYKSITPEMSQFLQACIEARLNVLVSGGTGSGKTTLLNVLSNFIPNTERILTVEDSAELQISKDHVGRLETRPPSVEGTGAVTIRDLVKQTLRMKPDRIIVGEVRSGEALDMLQAMNTGHDGSMATVHSNSPKDCLSRVETLVMMAGMDLPIMAIREQVSSAVHLIVQQARLSDGSRKVTHITEVTGMQGDKVTTQDIFLFRQKGMDENRKVIGRHMPTGFIPSFMEKIESIGIKLPKGIFKAA